MCKCEICGRSDFKNYKSLSPHIRKTHKINSKEYYDEYLKKEDKGTCLICGKETKFENLSTGYRKYCKKCKTKSNYRIDMLRQVFINNSENIINKRKQTCLEKYGVDNPNKNKEVRDKIEQTCLENYGTRTPFTNEKIIKKIKNTNIKKYGVDNPTKNNEIKEKIKQINIEKYGCICPLHSEKIKEKVKLTNLEKYGFDNPLKNKEIKERGKQTYLNNFISKVEEILEINNLELLSDYNHNRKLIKLRCKTCNSIFETQYFYIQQGYGKCSTCFPKNSGISNLEKEISVFIKSIESSEIIENSREIIKPYELDIYIPSKNIAIEFNGLYYHSEEHGKDNNYHLNKTELCESKNIQLIHIFEDEWIYKQEIVKSRLKQLLNLNYNLPKIHARKCVIKEISPEIKNEFLEKYHLQGKDNSNIKLGAFYNDELISVMTFSHGNISKGSKNIKNIWELNRFCSNYNYHIPGIASKLFSYFKKNYVWKEIFSYADRRWSNGNVYYRLNFNLDNITKPNYWYVKDIKRIHRFNLRKRPDEPKDITEAVLRSQEGYHRIYDCGHLKFKMIKT